MTGFIKRNTFVYFIEYIHICPTCFAAFMLPLQGPKLARVPYSDWTALENYYNYRRLPFISKDVWDKSNPQKMIFV